MRRSWSRLPRTRSPQLTRSGLLGSLDHLGVLPSALSSPVLAISYQHPVGKERPRLRAVRVGRREVERVDQPVRLIGYRRVADPHDADADAVLRRYVIDVPVEPLDGLSHLGADSVFGALPLLLWVMRAVPVV